MRRLAIKIMTYHPTLFYFYDLFIQVSIKNKGFCVEYQLQIAVTNSCHNLQLPVAWGSAPGIMQQ